MTVMTGPREKVLFQFPGGQGRLRAGKIGKGRKNRAAINS